jgi:hypothetical protein
MLNAHNTFAVRFGHVERLAPHDLLLGSSAGTESRVPNRFAIPQSGRAPIVPQASREEDLSSDVAGFDVVVNDSLGMRGGAHPIMLKIGR